MQFSLCDCHMLSHGVCIGQLYRPPDKSAYQKKIFLFLSQNVGSPVAQW